LVDPESRISQSGLSWRPDIEGLRGVAVLAVLVFHAFPSWLSGGFVGVDVFFVISGYVVARLIIAELADGRFRLSAFYGRRARRIFPALVTVLLASLCVAPFVVGSEDYKALGLQVAATAVFMANFWALSVSGYFETEAAYQPLIHLWSLGVEEQFYALLPVTLTLLWRYCRHRVGLMLVLATMASFVACVIVTAKDGNAAFYLPMTRFWELLAGSVLAAYEHGRGSTFVPKSPAFSAVGAALLAASFLLLTESQSFPGWQAALPVIGSFCILAATPSRGFNRVVLSSPALRWMGGISYAAYLWHWPLLVFSRYATGAQLSEWTAGALLCLTLVLAWITTRYIERPFRTHAPLVSANATRALWASLVLVGAIAIPVTRALQGSSAPALVWMENYPRPDHDIWREGRNCFVNLNVDVEFGAECMGGTAGGPRVVLWGDSHAAHLWPGLQQQADRQGWRLAQLTVSQCPSLIRGIGEGNNKCEIMRRRALEAIRSIRPNVVILASRWTFDRHAATLDAIGPTISYLKDSGIQRVVVVGPVPMWQPSLARALAADMKKDRLSSVPDTTTTGFDQMAFIVDREMKLATTRAGGDFVSALDIMCVEQDKCRVWIDAAKTELTTYDSGHLALRYSAWFAEKISANVFREP
jgi:peptidoglycan/LPS O-acetylase OafA/YrhL